MLSVLRDGYRMPFMNSPLPLTRTLISFPMYWSGSPRSVVLGQEIKKMLAKDALEIVLDACPSFYSRLFLVDKATGGWHPVIDLSHLNEFVLQTPLKMETIALVLLSVREGDFLASIDLKDVYFHIPVHQSSRKLSRFLSGGVVFQFKALCFGLSTAPQVFTRVFAAVSAWAHSRGICLLWYLDDYLVLASSEAVAKKNVRDLLSLCHSLGVVINEEKSDLVPSQTANNLGMAIEVSTRAVQCPGRSPQLSGSGYRDKVVSPTAGGESTSFCLGLPSLDLFATRLNAKLRLYCSLAPCPQAVFKH